MVAGMPTQPAIHTESEADRAIRLKGNYEAARETADRAARGYATYSADMEASRLLQIVTARSIVVLPLNSYYL